MCVCGYPHTQWNITNPLQWNIMADVKNAAMNLRVQIIALLFEEERRIRWVLTRSPLAHERLQCLGLKLKSSLPWNPPLFPSATGLKAGPLVSALIQHPSIIQTQFEDFLFYYVYRTQSPKPCLTTSPLLIITSYYPYQSLQQSFHNILNDSGPQKRDFIKGTLWI